MVEKFEKGIDPSRLEETLDPDYLCFFCKHILWEPLCCHECELIVCAPCLKSWVRNNETCPNTKCKTKINYKTAHKLIYKQLQSYNFTCHNSPTCKEVFKYQEIKSHICGYDKATCPVQGCRASVYRKDIQKHVEECDMRRVKCPHCHLEMLSKQIKEHLGVCELAPLKCNKCSKEILRREREMHMEICPKVVISCEHQVDGCTYKSTRDLLPVHQKDCPCKTLECAKCRLTMLGRELKAHECIRDMGKCIVQQGRALEYQREELKEQNERIHKLEELVENINTRFCAAMSAKCGCCEKQFWKPTKKRCGECKNKVCPNCCMECISGSECPQGGILCRKCGESCLFCKRGVCHKCTTECHISKCKQKVCKQCVTISPTCGLGVCRNCLSEYFEECGVCKSQLCRECHSKSMGLAGGCCNNLICKNCIHKFCDTCSACICNNCKLENKCKVFGCLARGCNKCLTICVDCNELACQGCRDQKCKICKKNICRRLWQLGMGVNYYCCACYKKYATAKGKESTEPLSKSSLI